MRFRYKDLRKIDFKSTKNYMIKRMAYYNSIEEAYKDIYRIYELMKYNVKINKKYEDISFVIAMSTTDGKGAKKLKITTKGRPKYKIYGNKVQPHIHIACYGKKAPTFAKKIATKLNKNIYKDWETYKRRGYKGKRLFTIEKLKGEDYGLSYVPYIFQQADKILTYGNMEFEKLRDQFFININEQNF